jgi:hypothetical protein
MVVEQAAGRDEPKPGTEELISELKRLRTEKLKAAYEKASPPSA